MRGAREHNLKDVTVAFPRDRLVVITGLSGSGKSSLAFDTIYAEGQRRYVESLRAYARQFLGQMEKPDVDQIDGLSPAISIDQKGASRNPRSTVGTVTEIYDYLRLLFARIGHPALPQCGREIERQTVQQIVDQVLALPEGTRLLVLGPADQGPQDRGRPRLRGRPQAGLRPRPRRRRASTTSPRRPTLDKYKRHTIEVVVDRFVVRRAEAPEGWARDADGRPIDPETGPAVPDPDAARLADSVETALRLGEGVVLIAPGAARRRGAGLRGAPLQRALQLPVRRHHDRRARAALASRSTRRTARAPPAPGLGTQLEIDPDLVIPDRSKSIQAGRPGPVEQDADRGLVAA